MQLTSASCQHCVLGQWRGGGGGETIEMTCGITRAFLPVLEESIIIMMMMRVWREKKSPQKQWSQSCSIDILLRVFCSPSAPRLQQ